MCLVRVVQTAKVGVECVNVQNENDENATKLLFIGVYSRTFAD